MLRKKAYKQEALVKSLIFRSLACAERISQAKQTEFLTLSRSILRRLQPHTRTSLRNIRSFVDAMPVLNVKAVSTWRLHLGIRRIGLNLGIRGWPVPSPDQLGRVLYGSTFAWKNRHCRNSLQLQGWRVLMFSSETWESIRFNDVEWRLLFPPLSSQPPWKVLLQTNKEEIQCLNSLLGLGD